MKFAGTIFSLFILAVPSLAFAQTASSTVAVSGSVDLVVESTSLVPPFYTGKAIFATQGTARIIALPNVMENGSALSANDLVFTWQRDGQTLSAESGAGKDAITVSGTVPIRDISVSVSVSDASGNVLATASKILSPADPKVLVYEDNPLYGILFNKAMSGNYYLGQRSELDLVAEPYFFNLASIDGQDSTYKWFVNGNYASPSGASNELILKQAGNNLSGTAAVTLDANNNDRIFQYASTNFNVNFGI
ncbi:MAG: hypothetical protein KGH93_00940 [Patescibacteria group bacterium]|nr:hypothetical protein [Patescibacteria group bacterium]MDE1945746.1 hypothetical protein [Patescibacteria group bacterium]